MNQHTRYQLDEPELLWTNGDAPNSEGLSTSKIIERVDEHQDEIGLGCRLWRKGEGEWWWYLRKKEGDWLGVNPDEDVLDAMDDEEARFFLSDRDDSALRDVWAIPMNEMPRWGDGSAHE